MVKLLLLASLFFIIFGILIPSFRKLSNDSSQQEYVVRDFALAVFSVGAFSVGSWLIEMLFANY
jgi:hypothetical protein